MRQGRTKKGAGDLFGLGAGAGTVKDREGATSPNARPIHAALVTGGWCPSLTHSEYGYTNKISGYIHGYSKCVLYIEHVTFAWKQRGFGSANRLR